MGRAKPSAPEHTSTPVLSPISDARDDVMDLHWPPVSSWAQGKHTVLRSWPDKMPAPCQHLFLRHWWDIGTHAVGAKEWRRAWKCWELNRVKEGWRWINGAKKYRGWSKIVNDRDVKKWKPHGTIIPLQQGFDKQCSHCLLKKMLQYEDQKGKRVNYNYFTCKLFLVTLPVFFFDTESQNNFSHQI